MIITNGRYLCLYKSYETPRFGTIITCVNYSFIFPPLPPLFPHFDPHFYPTFPPLIPTFLSFWFPLFPIFTQGQEKWSTHSGFFWKAKTRFILKKHGCFFFEMSVGFCKNAGWVNHKWRNWKITNEEIEKPQMKKLEIHRWRYWKP